MDEKERDEREKHDRERQIKRRKLKQERIRRIRKMRILGYIAVILVLLLIGVSVYACLNKENKEAKEPEKKVEDTEKNVEEVYAEPEIDIVMVGDILLHEPVQESGKLADGTYNYDHLFANVAEDIQAADIAIANQEVILGGTEIGLSGYPNFNGPFEVGDALAKAGFNVVLHATNHTLDRGKEALVNCMNFWKQKKVTYTILSMVQT